MYFSESCGRREGLYHSQEMGHTDLEPYFDLSGEIISQYIYLISGLYLLHEVAQFIHVK